MQMNIPLMAELPSLKRSIDNDIIAKLKTEQDAYRVCIRFARQYLDEDTISKFLGIDRRGEFNKIKNSDRNGLNRTLSRVRQIKLQTLCGNKAIDQWAYMYENNLLDCQRKKVDQIAELEQQLAILKAQ